MSVTPMTIKLKASLYTLTIVQIYQMDLQAIARELEQLVRQTPQFFQQLPVILDIQCINTETGHFLTALNALDTCLRQYGLIPVGIRGSNTLQANLAQQKGWALFSDTKTMLPSASQTPSPPKEATLITNPVRSGQQIYAAGDLIVLGSVSPGAELLAEGHIHIYGRLSGRALAGVSDNPNAHIFCVHLEAELVAIAGHYWLYEDLQKNTLKSHVDLFLKQDQLQIRHLGHSAL